MLSGLRLKLQVSSPFSQPGSRSLQSVDVGALESSVDASEPASPGSVSALLHRTHPVGCLAVTEVMKVRRLPVQSHPCCSAHTGRWCRSAAGLHVVAVQVHMCRRSQRSRCTTAAIVFVLLLGLDSRLAACESRQRAKGRPAWVASSGCPLHELCSPSSGNQCMSTHHRHR